MFCEVFEISSGVTTCSEMTNFLKETNFLELTALLVMIGFLTRIAYIETANIGNTCIRDDFTKVVNIEIAVNIFIKGIDVWGTD